MTIQDGAAEHDGLEVDLRPNLAILVGGACVVGLISALSLPWPLAIASTLLGTLMIAGADVDARTFLLPNVITYGALIGGIIAAPLLDSTGSWTVAVEAGSARRHRGRCAGAVSQWLRLDQETEGLGLGDVKLAAAIGAWLSLDAIPTCFLLATGGALVTVVLARLSGQAMMSTTRIPFGAFLCPALWIVFFTDCLTR